MTEPKPSREFEKLVAKVERTLAGQNAVITSPDRIQDKDSHIHQLREIDVSIRMKVGSAPVLVMVECRKRGRRQDVDWVEQVIAKRDGVGADKAIMVPSHGLTALAREKAAAHGIVVTRFDRITVDDIKSWFQAPGVTVGDIQTTIRHADFAFREALTESEERTFPRKLSPQDKVLILRGTQHGQSIEGILDLILAKPNEEVQHFLSTCAAGNVPQRLHLRVVFANTGDPFEFIVGERPHEVLEILMEVDVSKSESQVQPFQVFSYGREGKPALDVVNFRLPGPAGEEETLSLQRDRESGILTVQMGPPGTVPELLPDGTPLEKRRE